MVNRLEDQEFATLKLHQLNRNNFPTHTLALAKICALSPTKRNLQKLEEQLKLDREVKPQNHLH